LPETTGYGRLAVDNASCCLLLFFFFQAEDGIRDLIVTGVQTCALPIFPAVAEVTTGVAKVAVVPRWPFRKRYCLDADTPLPRNSSTVLRFVGSKLQPEKSWRPTWAGGTGVPDTDCGRSIWTR